MRHRLAQCRSHQLLASRASLSAVFDAVNKLPRGMHGVDVMRVREWYLQGKAKQYRQSILMSSFCFPELKSLLSTQCMSHSGMAKLQMQYEVRYSHISFTIVL